MNKKININNIFLFDVNPRFSTNEDSKKRILNIKFDEINKENEKNTIIEILKHEGDFKDLYDLILSIKEKGFLEEIFGFILLEFEKEKNKKYIVTDGNRRLLALKIISKTINLEDFENEKTKNNENWIKIKNEIKDMKNSLKDFEYSKIFSSKNNEIERMFEYINMSHTGSGNGKRSWPRGKILNEIYKIYSDENNENEKILNLISKKLGITKSKASSDLINSIWFISLLNKFNEINSEKIDVNLIAPSSVELILSTKLNKLILKNEMNVENFSNLRELFEIKIISDRSAFPNNIKFNNKIDIDILAKLIFEGYLIGSDNTINSFSDVEKDNEENHGLIRNKYFSTREWFDIGTNKLLEILIWPKGISPNEKIEEIEKNEEKIFKLDRKSAIEISEILNDKKYKSNNDFNKIKKLIDEFIETDELIKTNFKKSNLKNHIYQTLIEIYQNEFNSLIKSKIDSSVYYLKDIHTVSQLGVLRTMYELANKLIILSLFSNFKNSDLTDQEIISKIKKQKTNIWNKYMISNNLWDKRIKDFKISDEKKFYKLCEDFQIKFDKDELETTFNDIRYFSGFGAIFKGFPFEHVFKDIILNDVKLDEKKIYFEYSKKLKKFNEIVKNNLGKKISLPLHHFDKFVKKINNVNRPIESLIKLNKDFIEVFNEFSNLILFLNENCEIVLLNDEINDEIFRIINI